MSALRGFGFVITNGDAPRYWFVGKDGVRRWSDTGYPVEGDTLKHADLIQVPVNDETRPDAELVASARADIARGVKRLNRAARERAERIKQLSEGETQ